MENVDAFRNFRIAIFTSLLFCLAQQVVAQPNIYLKSEISANLVNPMLIAHAGDGSKRIFVAERLGVIKVFSQTYQYIGVYLDISSRVSTAQEGALLSIAFHPDFKTNGCLFVHFSDKEGNIVISRYDSQDPTQNVMTDNTPVDLIKIPHPNTNHYGGEMHFGSDGNLYVSTGDGGGSNDSDFNNAQTETSLLGKMLRITVATSGADTYTNPLTNPYPAFPANPSDPRRSEVYAIGLRNPFRWSFDKSTGDMWIGDVGQGTQEEIDFCAVGSINGANFAWRCYEGSVRNPAYDNAGHTVECAAYPNFTPKYSYGRTLGRSVVGGAVYRGTRYPAMAGYYIGADHYTGNFHVFAPGAGTLSTMTMLVAKTGLSDFGESEDGDMFAVSLTGNEIFRFVDANVEPLPVKLVQFSGQNSTEGVRLNWQTAMEENFQEFEVQFSNNAKTFFQVGNVLPSNKSGEGDYQFTHVGVFEGYYRLKMIDKDETYTFSRIINVNSKQELTGFVWPAIINTGTMNVNLTSPYNALEFLNTSGHTLFITNISGKTGIVEIPVHTIGAGLYIVRLVSDDKETVQQKVVVAP